MESSDDAARAPGIQPPPSLPEVDSPPSEDVLAGVPSKEEVVEDAQSADEIVAAQPSVDDLLGPDRRTAS
jgi:hypothetical protein